MEKKQNGIAGEDAGYKDKDQANVNAKESPEADQGNADSAAEGSPEERIKQLEEALAKKEAEAAGNWDKFVRERADLENYRKRAQREKEDLLKYGNESLLLEILPIIDNMERALEHASDDSLSAVVQGVELTLSMLVSAMKKFGVSPVEAKGKAFDPAFHQAMTQVESVDQAPNTVLEEFQKGYMLNDRLLRAALVSVSAPPKKVDQ